MLLCVALASASPPLCFLHTSSPSKVALIDLQDRLIGLLKALIYMATGSDVVAKQKTLSPSPLHLLHRVCIKCTRMGCGASRLRHFAMCLPAVLFIIGPLHCHRWTRLATRTLAMFVLLLVCRNCQIVANSFFLLLAPNCD